MLLTGTARARPARCFARLETAEGLRLTPHFSPHPPAGRTLPATIANVSYVDFDYRPAHPAAVFEL